MGMTGGARFCQPRRVCGGLQKITSAVRGSKAIAKPERPALAAFAGHPA